MLHKRSQSRKCLTNPSSSFSNLHHPEIIVNIREFCLRKSLFNPESGLAQSYAARHHILGADVPLVDVVHSTNRWLLLQAPRYSRSFFRLLNTGSCGNPFQQLLKIFTKFTTLTNHYGFFRPTATMIFLDGREVKVWINEDVFSNHCLMPLSSAQKGQKQYVVAFLAMIQNEVQDWERVSNIFTIKEVVKLLEWRVRLTRSSLTAVRANKHPPCRQNQSITSFEMSQFGTYNQQLKVCRSVQEIEQEMGLDFFQTDLSSSVTIKEEQCKGFLKIGSDKQFFGMSSSNSKLKQSDGLNRNIEGSTEVRRTKKKFNLTSTSSTLQRFSQKWRSTVGKKANKQLERPVSDEPQLPKSPIIQAQHQPTNILNQLQGLFGEDQCFRELKLGVEGDREQLQRIAQQMEQVLIW